MALGHLSDKAQTPQHSTWSFGDLITIYTYPAISLRTSCLTCSAITTPIASGPPSTPLLYFFPPGPSLEVLLRFHFIQEVFSDSLSPLLIPYSMQSSKMASCVESSGLLTAPAESKLLEKVGSFLEVNLREGRGYHQRTFEERPLEEGPFQLNL